MELLYNCGRFCTYDKIKEDIDKNFTSFCYNLKWKVNLQPIPESEKKQLR